MTFPVDTFRWKTPTPGQTGAGNYFKPRLKWQGIQIAIENPAGSVRLGKKPDGTEWRTYMHHHYGYITRSEGVDGDEVDCFVGPHLDLASEVYVVHQRKVGAWDEYDEDKIMLGMLSLEAAREAFLMNYDDPRFLGPITTLSVPDFITKVKETRKTPRMIKAVLLFGPVVMPQ